MKRTSQKLPLNPQMDYGATLRNRPASQLIGFMIAAWLLLILYTTLFPFGFVLGDNNLLGEVSSRFDVNLIGSRSLIDLLRNIFLFLPIGFGFTYLLPKKEWRGIKKPLVILVIGLGLSLIVELLQVFLPEREPSLSDLLTNGLGVFLGSLCFCLWGNRVVGETVTLVNKGKAHFSIARITAVFLGYVILLIFFSIYLQSQSALSNWDLNFPLILGNERTGDRPWQGYISELYITNRVLTEEEVRLTFAEKETLTSIEDALVASYRLSGEANYDDQTGALPDLSWRSKGRPPEGEGGVLLTPEQWLETTTPVTFLIRKLRETSQFTLSTIVASAGVDQTGPARIISISADPFQRNLTIGQELTDLIIRLRIPITGENGAKPEVVIPNVFMDTRPHHLIISYDGSNLQVYVDRLQHSYRIHYSPEVMIFRYFLPVSEWRIRPNTGSIWFYGLLYYSLVFAPLGLMLGLIGTLERRSVFRVILTCGIIILPAFILEGSLASVRGDGMRLNNLMLSMVITIIAMIVTSLPEYLAKQWTLF